MVLKYIQFHNNSDLPLIIESWVDNSHSLHQQYVKPRESLIIHSNVGEWHIQSMFNPGTEERKRWEEKGLKDYLKSQ
jgi:hypothetical protein